ncbi:MAG: hypothetical protein EB830_05155 [Nitrosopumilus sp. H13]|nr:MAG: hypothetical protein EB830_05155 [Nitrosopumilus sp. H13]
MSLNTKKTTVDGRSFSLTVQTFENGCLVFVSEGPERIGSMTVSLATGPAPVTTTIIPSKTESLFLKMMAERLSTRARGIALVSVFVQGDLGNATAKALMSEIMEMVETHE